jgi:hypothetical protein
VHSTGPQRPSTALPSARIRKACPPALQLSPPRAALTVTVMCRLPSTARPVRPGSVMRLSTSAEPWRGQSLLLATKTRSLPVLSGAFRTSSTRIVDAPTARWADPGSSGVDVRRRASSVSFLFHATTPAPWQRPPHICGRRPRTRQVLACRSVQRARRCHPTHAQERASAKRPAFELRIACVTSPSGTRPHRRARPRRYSPRATTAKTRKPVMVSSRELIGEPPDNRHTPNTMPRTSESQLR